MCARVRSVDHESLVCGITHTCCSLSVGSGGALRTNAFTVFCRYDYFLVSQSVRQGTVSPTHYNVIYDSWGLPPDRMQMLSYKLTHLYYNWPVSVVSVQGAASFVT